MAFGWIIPVKIRLEIDDFDSLCVVWTFCYRRIFARYHLLSGINVARGFADVTIGIDTDRWPHNGYIKKLIRKDGCWYYFNKSRECSDKDVPKCKPYSY
uniref:Uncharacterized protein n=1 Tax=Magallana gigas TaxID=29159 RepID=K1QU38_MAGGI